MALGYLRALLRASLVALLLDITQSAAPTGRFTNNVIAEYFFDQTTCKGGSDAFAPTITTDSQSTGNTKNLLTTVDSVGCPLFTANGFDFPFASNGITANGAKAGSKATFTDVSFIRSASNGVSFEFWLHQKLIADTPAVIFETSRQYTTAPSSWVLNTDFSIQITAEPLVSGTRNYVMNFQGQLTECSSPDTEEIVHLVFTRTALGGSNAVTFTCYINGVAKTTQARTLNTAYPTAHTQFTMGGTPDLLLASPSKVVFPGNVMLAAIYNVELTAAQISTTSTGLFQRGPGTNLPATPTNGVLDHPEDSTSTVDLNEVIFNYDVAFGGSSGNALQAAIPTVPTSGKLSINGAEKTSAIAAFTVATTTVTYKQNVKDQDEIVDTFVLTPSNNVGTGFSNTISIKYSETNDKPVAISTNFKVVENFDLELFLSVEEPADAQGTEEGVNTFPANFTILTRSTNPSDVDLGDFVDCDTKAILDAGAVLFDIVREGTVFKAALCYEAKLQDTITSDAVIGTETLTFNAIDKGGLSSDAVGTIVLTVLNPVSAGCTNLDDKSLCISGENEITTNVSSGSDTDLAYTVNLVGVDGKCVDPSANQAICDERASQISFKIIAPLPDPDTEGTLMMRNGAGDLVPITIDAGTDGTTVLGQADQVFFFPVQNYFNLFQSPQCLINNNFQLDQGKCAGSANAANYENLGNLSADDALDIFGTSFTPGTGIVIKSSTARREIRYGTCDADGNATHLGGCPVRIFYRMIVNGGSSSEDSSVDPPTHVIWVRNTLSNDNAEVNMLGEYTNFNPAQTSLVATRVAEQIQVVDPDGAAKNIFVQVGFKNQAGQVQVISSDLESIHANVNNEFFIAIDSALVGKTRDTVNMIAPVSIINEILAKLRVQVDNIGDGAEFAELEIGVSLPNRGNFINGDTKQTFTTEMTLKGGSGNSNNPENLWERPEFVAIVAFVGFLLLLCCYGIFRRGGRCAYGIYHSGKVQAKKGRRKHDIIRLRDGEEDSSAAEERRKKKWSYKCGVVLYVLGGPFCLATFCPCLWSFEREIVEEFEDSDDELDESNKKKNNDISEEELQFWETRETEKKGKTITYYYNTKTHERSWVSPFPEDRAKAQKKRGNEETLELGKKKLKFKPFMKKKDKSKAKRKKSASDDDEHSKGSDSSRNKQVVATKRPQKPEGRAPVSSGIKSLRDGPSKPSGNQRFAPKPPAQPKGGTDRWDQGPNDLTI